MDTPWTPWISRPPFFYRVVTPATNCNYSPLTGFRTTSRRTFESSKRLPHFLKSITEHITGVQRNSPYISVFEDKCEAEDWTLAAEELYGEGCLLVEIDATHECFGEGNGKRWVWRVEDLGRGISNMIETSKGGSVEKHRELEKVGTVLMGSIEERGGSEWMVTHTIPREAIRFAVTAEEILMKRIVEAGEEEELEKELALQSFDMDVDYDSESTEILATTDDETARLIADYLFGKAPADIATSPEPVRRQVPEKRTESSRSLFDAGYESSTSTSTVQGEEYFVPPNKFRENGLSIGRSGLAWTSDRSSSRNSLNSQFDRMDLT